MSIDLFAEEEDVHYEHESLILGCSYFGLISTFVSLFSILFLTYRLRCATPEAIHWQIQFFAVGSLTFGLIYSTLQWTVRTDEFWGHEFHCPTVYPVIMAFFWAQRFFLYLFFVARLRVSFADSVYRISDRCYYFKVVLCCVVLVPFIVFHEIEDEPVTKASRAGHKICESINHPGLSTVYWTFAVTDTLLCGYLVGFFTYKLSQLLNETASLQKKAAQRRDMTLSRTRSNSGRGSKRNAMESTTTREPTIEVTVTSGNSENRGRRADQSAGGGAVHSSRHSSRSRSRNPTDENASSRKGRHADPSQPVNRSRSRSREANKQNKHERKSSRDGYESNLIALHALTKRTVMCGVVAILTTWMIFASFHIHNGFLLVLKPGISIVNSLCIVFVFAVKRKMCTDFVCYPLQQCNRHCNGRINARLGLTDTFKVVQLSNKHSRTEMTSGHTPNGSVKGRLGLEAANSNSSSESGCGSPVADTTVQIVYLSGDTTTAPKDSGVPEPSPNLESTPNPNPESTLNLESTPNLDPTPETRVP